MLSGDLVSRTEIFVLAVHNNSLVPLVAEALTSVEASTSFRRRIEAKFATEIHAALAHSLASP
jgi:hypothetical protein